MATDKTASWSLGENVLWYSPNSTLDAVWSLGESFLVDEYEATASLILAATININLNCNITISAGRAQ